MEGYDIGQTRPFLLFFSGSDSSTSDVKSIAKKTVHLLATRFLEQHPSYVEAVGLVFMDHLLQNPKVRSAPTSLLIVSVRVHINLTSFSHFRPLVCSTKNTSDLGLVQKACVELEYEKFF